ncbi:hypothetical protein [Zobellella denitrificans]|uniref:hypothetical protein n=1 Tax=Zobellella denitrificans TaxID=347534 RepID=UPI00115C59C1|nr:hypothetical protein [Zobellella denitrificans]
MIIKIESKDHNSIFDNHEKTSCLENILQSYGEGKNIVIAEKTLLEKIINDNNGVFGRTIKRYASHLKTAQIELNSTIKNVSFYVEVNFDDNEYTDKIINNDDTHVFKVGYNHFSSSENTQSATILCEDIVDTEFYGLITKYFLEQRKLSNLSMRYKPENGGGANIKKVFDDLERKGMFCLCIVDNDKKHPNSSLGSTCRAFKDITYKKKCRVLILDVHEAESLIPTATIEEIVRSEHYPPHIIDSIDYLKKISSLDPRAKFHFDHKSGIKLKQALHLDHMYGEFWIPIISEIKEAKKAKCLQSKECDADCSCFSIHGFGDNILLKSIEMIKKRKMSSLSKETEQEVLEKWLEIGKVFFSYSCAPPKRARL